MKKTKCFLRTAALTAALLAALLLAACDQAGLPPTADPSYPETETGTGTGTNPGPGIGSGAKLGSITVTVAAAGNPSSGQSQSVAAAQSFKAAALQSVARTVVPVIDSAFQKFVLTFTPQSGGKDIEKETTATTVTVKLPPDTYSLEVKGVKGDTEIAVGEVSEVVIAIDAPVEETVDLKPMTTDDNPDLADGVFSYDVTLLAKATKATLTLTEPKPEGATVKAINLKDKADGTENLSPGEYWLAVSLENEDETDKESGDILGFSGEVVYIYSKLESPFVKNFLAYELVKTKGPLDLDIRFGPSTVVGETGTPLTFEQGASSTFTLTVPDTFDNIAWYLDGVKLNDQENGVNGNIYIAPGAMLYGTHFITATAKSTANGQTYSQLVDFHVTKKN